jgi:hypothetical protein
MLKRLIAWCVPDSALVLRAVEADRDDVGRLLSPYESRAGAAESAGWRIIGNS